LKEKDNMANAKHAVVPDALDASTLTNLMTPLAEAAEAIAKLEKQRTALSKRRAAHDAERQRLAYAARAQGDPEASKRLAELADEAIRSGHEVADIDAALVVAREHLQRAQDDEARQRCAEVREVVVTGTIGDGRVA
jgi:ATP/maltotriose-dependent transcriptional regulator MalT